MFFFGHCLEFNFSGRGQFKAPSFFVVISDVLLIVRQERQHGARRTDCRMRYRKDHIHTSAVRELQRMLFGGTLS